MAQKRMFDRKVVESDKFIELPNSSKALYFMAGMDADDKGFFQPKKLQRLCGFSDDDYKILIAKGYFIPFESGVMVVTDWNKNNWLDNRRISETEYTDELNLLRLVNQRYELNNPCLANAKPMLRENRIEEYSIEENRIDDVVNNNINNKIIKSYEENIGLITPATAQLLFSYLDDFTGDIIIKAINIASINNKKSAKYISGILNDWNRKGLKTLLDIENAENNFNKNKRNDENETEEEKIKREAKEMEERLKNADC